MKEDKKIKRVLLVDDDPVNNILSKKRFLHSGIIEEVDIVTDGQQAYDYLVNKNFDIPELIFLDINMPVMDGFEFLKKFSESNAPAKVKSRIIVVSAYYNDEEIKDIADYDEVIAYIEKPITEEKVIQAAEHYFRRVDQKTREVL